MNINLVNEVAKPKKIVSIVINPEFTFKEVRDKVEKDKLVKLDGCLEVQVWHGDNRLFGNSTKIKDANLKDGDTLILRPGPDIVVDSSNPYIAKLFSMNYQEDFIRAALFKTGNNPQAALNLIISENRVDTYEDEDLDDAAYEIDKALEILKNTNFEVFNRVISDSQLKGLFATRLVDCLNEFQATLSEEESSKVLVEYVNGFLEYLNELEPLKAMIAQLQQDQVSGTNPYYSGDMNAYPEEARSGGSNQLNSDDAAAIDRLVKYGFDREAARQAYILVERDERAALDMLIDLQQMKK